MPVSCSSFCRFPTSFLESNDIFVPFEVLPFAFFLSVQSGVLSVMAGVISCGIGVPSLVNDDDSPFRTSPDSIGTWRLTLCACIDCTSVPMLVEAECDLDTLSLLIPIWCVDLRKEMDKRV